MDLVSLVSAYRAHNISHVLGKTTDVINKLIRPDLPYYRRYYSHVFIFSVQFSDPSPSNPWNLLKVAIQKGMLDKAQFTFFTSLDKKNFLIIQRRIKNGNECLVIIDDFADQLGDRYHSLSSTRVNAQVCLRTISSF